MMESVSLINCVLMKLKSRLWSRHWSSNNLLSRQSKMERKNGPRHLKVVSVVEEPISLGRTGVECCWTPPQK